MRLMERENGPVCLILLLILLVSAAIMTGGIVKYMDEGWTDNSIILVLFGAIVFVFVVMGFVITLCTEQLPHRQPARLPYSDNPPKYRETWRRQHLESICSQTTDTITGNPSHMTGGSTTTTLSRLDVRNLFSALPKVHRNPRTVSISVINENEDTGPGTSRTRANTAPQGFDKFEEPPSYAEALRRERTMSQCSPD